MENIIFKTRNLAKYYTENRQHWDDFYLSEKRIMSSVMDRFENAFSVLDVGCACGGLAGAHRGPGALSGDKGPDGQRRSPVQIHALPDGNFSFLPSRERYVRPAGCLGLCHRAISPVRSRYNPCFR